MLQLTGTKSGREINKMTELGLTAFESLNKSIYYKEARLVMECKKLYFQDIDPEHFLDETILKNYPKRDFHRMYIAEITECLEYTNS
jgi:flavin reductase (DIM6/NTAB) family NADH-FMN oxidoreductase RutF